MDQPAAPAQPDAISTDDFVVIPAALLSRAKENRALVDDEDFRALVESVRQYGILQPLWVRTAADGYEVVAGERRLAAATELGLESVPAIVLDYDEDVDRLAVMWAENFNRRDLSTMEKAQHIGHLAELGLSQREIAERIGLSQPQVSKLHTLLKLPEKARGWVESGELTQDEGVKLAGLPVGEVKKLVPATAKRPPAPWKIDQAHESLKTQAAMVKGRELAKEKGLKVLKENGGPHGYIGPTTHDNGPVRFPRSQADTYATLAHVDKKAHEVEPCHAVIIGTRGDRPLLVPACTNPAAHPRPKGWKPKTASGTEVKPHRSTEWADRRKRKDAAVDAHLPPLEALAREALALALKHEEDDYCLDFAAYALVELGCTTCLWEAAELLGVPGDTKHPHSTDSLLKSLLAPTPDTVDGFSVLYASALAAGLGKIEEEIGHIVETDKKRQAWTEHTIEQAKRFLAHLDGLVAGVPKYEALVAAVKGGQPLNTAAPEPERAVGDPAVPTVTFATHSGKIRRSCSACGLLGATTTVGNAAQLARKHLDENHDGEGVVQEALP